MIKINFRTWVGDVNRQAVRLKAVVLNDAFAESALTYIYYRVFYGSEALNSVVFQRLKVVFSHNLIEQECVTRVLEFF